MITRRILPLAALLSLAIFTGSFTGVARAQTAQNDETAALRQKAFELLESVAGQVGTLQSAENRARLGANVADSLWTRDEKRARSVLLQVEGDIRAELQKWQPHTGSDLTLMVFLKLRAETVERIAKHDGEAALAFLKGTEFKSEDMPKSASQNLEDIELRLAHKMVADNPEAAVKLASEALDQGFSYNLVPLLTRLNRKHKEPAQALFNEIIKKLQNTDLFTNWNARYFASSLVQSYRPPAANESSFRELISTLVASGLKNGCGDKVQLDAIKGNFCHWVASEVSQMQRFDARVSRLKHWAPEVTEDVSREPAGLQELGDLLDEGTTEEILAAAAKYPEYAEPVYWHLIDRARQAGDFEQVRKLAGTYITDPEVRKNVLAQLDKLEKKAAHNEASLAEMEEKLNTIPRLEHRISFLFAEAHRIGPGDRKLALKLLDRASDLSETMKPGKDQTGAQITLAVLYCYEKSDRCMGLMESRVPRLNDQVDVAAKLDGYETNYLRDGEWNMSAYGTVGHLLTHLSQSAGPFAWFDFDRAVSLANRFDRPEIRMMAHVKLAQGILAGPPKRIRTLYSER